MVLIPTRESDFSLKSVHCSWANWLSVLQYYSCLCSWNLCCTLIVFRCVHSNQVSCGCFWLELGQFWKRMPFPFARAAEDVGSSCQGTNDFNLHLKSYPSLNRHLRLSGPVSSHEFWASYLFRNCAIYLTETALIGCCFCLAVMIVWHIEDHVCLSWQMFLTLVRLSFEVFLLCLLWKGGY